MSAATPQHVGPYAVLEELGRGGAGVVYRCRDPRSGADVAVKLLTAQGKASPHQLARFRREVRALKALLHPNLVRLLDAGEHQGRPYLVLEYLRGRDLQERLDRGGPLLPWVAARIVHKVATALAVAHAQGLVHRDVKPANILLVRAGEPVLLDFGLVRSLDPAASRLTATGVFVGTPGYWSPEQAAGSKTVGPPTDVYALGATLYAALTGRPPYAGGNLMEILQAMQAPIPPPSTLAPGHVPERLEGVVLRALARDPQDRYPHAGALADALADALAVRSVRHRAGTPVSSLSYALAGAALALALIGGVLLVASGGDRGTPGVASRTEHDPARAPPGADDPASPRADDPEEERPGAPRAAEGPRTAGAEPARPRAAASPRPSVLLPANGSSEPEAAARPRSGDAAGGAVAPRTEALSEAAEVGAPSAPAVEEAADEGPGSLRLRVEVEAAFARRELLEGVGALPHSNMTPGAVHVFGPRAFAVLTGRARQGGVAAALVGAAFAGKGRALALGHDAYLKAQGQGNGWQVSSETRRFLLNGLRWLCKDRPLAGIRVALTGPCELVDFLARQGARPLRVSARAPSLAGCDLVVVPHTTVHPLPPAAVAALQDFVRGGGGLLTAVTGWGTQQVLEKKGPFVLRRDLPAQRILAPFGLAFDADTYVDPVGGPGYLVARSEAERVHTGNDLEDMAAARPLPSADRRAALLRVIALAECSAPDDPLFVPRLRALASFRASADDRLATAVRSAFLQLLEQRDRADRQLRGDGRGGRRVPRSRRGGVDGRRD
ncbi:MAG: serine/threonine protein kinase [Planctomycetota bacterium]|nr:MAG: serine/threonine protein kinase [Planctomycetota bacterium]